MGANLSVSLLLTAKSTPMKTEAASAMYKMELSFSFISSLILDTFLLLTAMKDEPKIFFNHSVQLVSRRAAVPHKSAKVRGRKWFIFGIDL